MGGDKTLMGLSLSLSYEPAGGSGQERLAKNRFWAAQRRRREVKVIRGDEPEGECCSPVPSRGAIRKTGGELEPTER